MGVAVIREGQYGAGTREVETLDVGGGASSSVVEFRDGASLLAHGGVTMSAGGVIRGNGTVATGGLPLDVPAGAELSSVLGETLHVVSGPLGNGGRVEAFGVPTLPAEIDFEGSVENAASTGFIAAHDALLRFRGDLTNFGTLGITGGFNDILGEVGNGVGGRVVVSGGATAVFYDDFVNSGAISVSAIGGVQSQVAFFGAFSGNGVSGAGAVFLEGDARPGFSPGEMSFGGSLSLGPFANFQFEIAGTTPVAEHDRLTVAGDLSLDGTAEIILINGFIPAVGDSFDLWEAGAVSGGFADLVLPVLPVGRHWHAASFDDDGMLSIGLTPDTYAAFATHFGLTGAAKEDDDCDGVANLIEYMLALDPTVHQNSTNLPDFFQAGGNDVFEFTMASPAGSDVILEVRRSEDLAGWMTIATRALDGSWSGPASVGLSGGGIGLQTVTVTHTTGAGPRYFYTLVATHVP